MAKSNSDNEIRRLLILQGSNDAAEQELDNLRVLCDFYGMSGERKDITGLLMPEEARANGDPLKYCKPLIDEICKDALGQYEYVYISTHGSTESFGEADGSKYITWSEFALSLCEADCLKAEAKLLLGCCRGGQHRVAHTMFEECALIDFVCGPRASIRDVDINAGLSIFLYNIEKRHEQPSTAIRRASEATGLDFFCHDRVEFEDYGQQIEEVVNQ